MIVFLDFVQFVPILLEYSISCFKALTELYNHVETLGVWSKIINKYLFMSLPGKWKLNDIDCYFIWKSLRHPEWR